MVTSARFGSATSERRIALVEWILSRRTKSRVVHPADTVASRLLIRIPAVIKPKIIAANSNNQPQYCVGCRRMRMK
jgi:hypothetical protein